MNKATNFNNLPNVKTIWEITCNFTPKGFRNSCTFPEPVLTSCDTCADNEYKNKGILKLQHDGLLTGARTVKLCRGLPSMKCDAITRIYARSKEVNWDVITLNGHNKCSASCCFVYLSNQSLEQNRSWEANRFSAGQVIPCILWNPNV